MEFKPWPKIPRFSRDIIVTEKLDGTNAQITIVPATEVSIFDDPLAVVCGNRSEPGAVTIFAGSRNRWITPGNDNYGFAAWVRDNAEELLKLGPGSHFGEWWGAGIQRRYGLKEKRFSLFNVARWGGCPHNDWKGLVEFKTGALGPACCAIVPTLYLGPLDTAAIEERVQSLRNNGSVAAPGFADPEGIVIFHTASGQLFKKTCKNDEKRKGQL